MKAVHTLAALVLVSLSLVGCSENPQSEAHPAPEKPVQPAVSQAELARIDALEAYRFVRYCITPKNRLPQDIDKGLRYWEKPTYDELIVDTSATTETILKSLYRYSAGMYDTGHVYSCVEANIFGLLGYPLPTSAYDADKELYEFSSKRRPKNGKEIYKDIQIFLHRDVLLSRRSDRDEKSLSDEQLVKQSIEELSDTMQKKGLSKDESHRVAKWFVDRMLRLAAQ